MDILARNNLNEHCSTPTALVIFGVTGDLTRRKLAPALYELIRSGRIEAPLHIIGFARRQWDNAALRDHLKESITEFARNRPVDPSVLEKFLSQIYFIQSSFSDPQGYRQLQNLLDAINVHNVLLYLSTPPDAYGEIIRQIGQAQSAGCCLQCARVVIEKPYGRDLTSARSLEEEVHTVFNEKQIFRIDHYLGKETVQNILVFRFANGIFEPLWNRNYVDHVQITAAETIGVGTRAGYYETAGVIRDIFQNHMLQLIALTAMEAPAAFNADAVRDEKVKIIRALRPLAGQEAIENTCRAQYTAGFINGQTVAGYKEEPGVSKDSLTETFMAARIFIDNWRWAGVPFYIRAGKRLAARTTEIAIQFKQPPLSLFNWQNMAGKAPNRLILNIQPDEGIALTFGAKTPTTLNQIAPVKMEFTYQDAFNSEPPDAYERLLLDALNGDATLFTRSDEVIAAWTFTTQIIEAWEANHVKELPGYPAGTWGPTDATGFIKQTGRDWYPGL